MARKRPIRRSPLITTSVFNQPEGKECPSCGKRKPHELFWARGRQHKNCNGCRAAARKGAKLRRPGNRQVSEVTVTDLDGNQIRTEPKYTASELAKVQGSHPGSITPKGWQV